MSRMRSEYLDPDRADRSVAAGVLVREELEEEEDEEDEGEGDDNDDKEGDDEGYSE